MCYGFNPMSTQSPLLIREHMHKLSENRKGGSGWFAPPGAYLAPPAIGVVSALVENRK